ncbi:hypothetical protein L3i22_062280 [Actinoplanes sp. L3-i22]|nr:hypothetical protein L3i22_062280 [Actinoplanes sp. L3-i22]
MASGVITQYRLNRLRSSRSRGISRISSAPGAAPVRAQRVLRLGQQDPLEGRDALVHAEPRGAPADLIAVRGVPQVHYLGYASAPA